MKRLEEIAQTFETSRPIFRLTKERNGTRINANTSHPVYRYRPQPVEGDILSELVCENFSEQFVISTGEFRVDHYEIAKRAMDSIRSDMPKFLEKNLEMRNPRQSKVYRWYYRNLPNSYDFNDALVLLYKYMRSFCDEDMKSSNMEHINNTIAIMEAIMEKYNDEK